MCPITGIPDSTMRRTRETMGPAPSSLTMSAPPSLTKRIALRTASSSDTWYEPNGMSPTTSGRFEWRETVLVRKSISSTVTGTVVPSWPRTTIAAVSPTRMMSTPASSAKRAPGES
jgi:hypothetical protein